jgi:hypothetical protein
MKKPIDLNLITQETTAFKSWSELLQRAERGYVPTIYPESKMHQQLRSQLARRGHRIFPQAKVKLTRLTETQADRIDEFIQDIEREPGKNAREARQAVVTSTTATMSLHLAELLVEDMEHYREDAIMNAGMNAETDEQVAFAERVAGNSIDALVAKVEKAMKRSLI